MLNLWQKMAKDSAPKCDNALNVVSNHCIMRNLLLKCPVKEASKTCEDYFEFGKKCKQFPMHHKKGDE